MNQIVQINTYLSAFHSWYFYVALLPSVILHEVSHGWVANHYGDPTAKNAHRLTLNPLAHIDPFGTVLLPALLLAVGFPPFGYAKPVPVNISRLRKPRQQSLYVSLAGPLVNIVLSAFGFVLCELSLHTSSETLFEVGVALGLSNLILALFNLLPIPPLDGSAIIERFVPDRHLGAYYHYRARALPLVMLFVILSEYVFHFGSNALGDAENWWLNLLIK
jgi:Zn-dependent protease